MPALIALPPETVERVLNMLAMKIGTNRIADLLDVPRSMVAAIRDETPKEALVARRARLGNRTNRASIHK